MAHRARSSLPMSPEEIQSLRSVAYGSWPSCRLIPCFVFWLPHFRAFDPITMKLGTVQKGYGMSLQKNYCPRHGGSLSWDRYYHLNQYIVAHAVGI